MTLAWVKVLDVIANGQLHESITQSWAAQGLYQVEEKEVLAGPKENKNVHDDRGPCLAEVVGNTNECHIADNKGS